ncbi:hypothetical protein [Beijerinckia sp. L45]|uniref:hypothetical protein n=1 Tax=Beijerinckia sp. L45 TaxID=1641855 RepID=UPI00131E5149|nr:hypothetical protein [Beijerinckia sp. L45]
MADRLTSRPPRAGLALNIHDTHLGIWQDDANDPLFEQVIFAGLIRHLRRRGWTVGPDADIVKNYPILRRYRRFCRKGELLATLEVNGRSIQFEVWSENWIQKNRNGHRHDFDKREKMPFLTRLRVDLEFGKIETWLQKHGPFETTNRNLQRRGPHFGGLTALQYIEREYATSIHKDKTSGRPVCDYAYKNGTSADGDRIEQGATVWFADKTGRINRGTAYFGINCMWRVVAGRWRLESFSASQIFTRQPEDLRRKRNEQRRRGKLEALPASAVGAMEFERAAKLRDILFGRADIFLIWHREHGAYYRSNHSGYTTDRISAGRYTRDEAASEVCRVPHLLSAMTLGGKRIEAADFAKAPLMEAAHV